MKSLRLRIFNSIFVALVFESSNSQTTAQLALASTHHISQPATESKNNVVSFSWLWDMCILVKAILLRCTCKVYAETRQSNVSAVSCQHLEAPAAKSKTFAIL